MPDVIPLDVYLDLQSLLELNWDYTSPDDQERRERVRNWLLTVEVTRPGADGPLDAPTNAPDLNPPDEGTKPAA